MAPKGECGKPSVWHRQDWLVCVEALVTLTEPEATTPQDRRAWELVETITTACEVDATAYIFEIDDSWGPETAVEAVGEFSTLASRLTVDDWALLKAALASFADAQQHSKRGQRACQLASVIGENDQMSVGH
mgnify:CR=1 FL=1